MTLTHAPLQVADISFGFEMAVLLLLWSVARRGNRYAKAFLIIAAILAAALALAALSMLSIETLEEFSS